MESFKGFISKHKKIIVIICVLFLVFSLLEVISSWLFNNTVGNVSSFPFRAVLQAIFIVSFWWLWVSILGFLIEHLSPNNSRNRLIHAFIAITYIGLHIGVMAFSWFMLRADLVNNVSFSFVYQEQFYKWFYIECFIYLAVVVAWQWYLKSHNNIQTNTPIRIKVKQFNGHYRVLYEDDLYWLEADNNYVHIHLIDQSLIHRATLSDMEKILGDNFFRCHRKALVNVKKIREQGDKEVLLSNGSRVPVSRRQKSLLTEQLVSD